MSGIRFKATVKNNPQTGEVAGYYATVVSRGYYDLDDIAEKIAANCMVTVHDVKGVLSALQQHIGEALQMNQSVRLGDLGSFRAVVNCSAVQDYNELDTSLIKKVRAEFRNGAGMDEKINTYTCSFEKIGDNDETEDEAEAEIEDSDNENVDDWSTES